MDHPILPPLGAKPPEKPPEKPPVKTLREAILEAVEQRIREAMAKFSPSLGRVTWRFDAENNVLFDGVYDTVVATPSLTNYKALSQEVKDLLPRVGAAERSLPSKANLEDGLHRYAEYRDGVFRREWPVSSAEQLTSLSGAHQGDVAVKGTERWLLTGASPQLASNWFSLATGSNVTSVNGKTGAVSLTPADVGALPTGTTPAQLGAADRSHGHVASQISDLNVWLTTRLVQGTGITIAEDPASHKLSLSISASGLGVDWGDLSNKPSTFPADWGALQGKPSSFPTTWGDVSGKPSSFPSRPADITGFDAGVRGAVDAALTQKTLSNFGAAAANAVGARLVSDTLDVTAPGSGQVRIELGPLAGGVIAQDATGTPSLPAKTLIFPKGSLTQISAGVVQVKISAGEAGGAGASMSYSPKYQRLLSATNPYPVRTEVVIEAVVRTAFAQADGRDIQVFSSAGAMLPTVIRAAVSGPNYVDYYIAFLDTMNGSDARVYAAKYGDPYAPQRQLYSNGLTKLLSRKGQSAGQLSVQYDPSAGFRPSDFLTGSPSWVNTASQEAGPPNTPLVLAGVEGVGFKLYRTSTTEWAGASGGFGGIELIPKNGGPAPAFLLSFDYQSILSVAQATGGAGGSAVSTGTCVVGRALPDGYVIDIRATGGTGDAYHDYSIRYRAGAGWVWTLHHVQGGPNAEYIAGPSGVRDGSGAAIRFFQSSSAGPGLAGYSNTPRRTDPATWIAFVIDFQQATKAQVSDEVALAP